MKHFGCWDLEGKYNKKAAIKNKNVLATLPLGKFSFKCQIVLLKGRWKQTLRDF